MAWIKLHNKNIASDERPLLVNTDLIYKIEPSGKGSMIHYIAPASNGHKSETVLESFAELTVMLTAEDDDG